MGNNLKDDPAQGRWSADINDLPLAVNGMAVINEVRIVIVAGSTNTNLGTLEQLLPKDIEIPVRAHSPYQDEPWRRKKPWRR